MAKVIGYRNTKGAFVKNIGGKDGLASIIDVLVTNNPRTGEREIDSRNTSLPALSSILSSHRIPQNITIALEYKIPITERRIDALITGYDKHGVAHAVIVEMKAWSRNNYKIKKDTVEFRGDTYSHPCYQAYSYQQILIDYNTAVQDGKINIHPLVYLYNMDDVSVFQGAYNVPVFGGADGDGLIKYLQSFLQKGDMGHIMDELVSAPITPSVGLREATKKNLGWSIPFA